MGVISNFDIFYIKIHAIVNISLFAKNGFQQNLKCRNDSQCDGGRQPLLE